MASIVGTTLRHHVVLIPGFFAFGRLGSLQYFPGVRHALERQFSLHGLSVSVHEVAIPPTASIRVRAARLLEALATIGRTSDGAIHLVGHSTGGLDARLAIAPTADLPTTERFNAYNRVRSLVTLATPHYGTPLASFLGGAMGKPLLRTLAMFTTFGLRYGRAPIAVGFTAMKLLSRLDNALGLNNTLLDHLAEKVLSRMTKEDRASMLSWVDEVYEDRSLVFQLTPAGLDLFNETTADPDDIRYGSVISQARAPNMRGWMGHRHDVYAHAAYWVFMMSYLITSRGSTRYFPVLSDKQEKALCRGLGALPSSRANDGVVPCRAQVWGEVIHAAPADHLDVVGHFAGLDARQPHADWMPTSSGFDRASFDALWRNVAQFLIEDKDTTACL